VLEPLPNAYLEPPHDYLTMLALLKSSQLVITDSGGIQEEGVALGVPVVVLRNVTERPEGVHAGALELIGNDPDVVLQRLRHLLTNPRQLAAMRAVGNPYGDGQAGHRVAQAVAWRLGLAERPQDWHYAPVEQVSYD
jgi:UDP-N-acetylglucosamine 2-epimerase (non-hydrolysing)